MIIILIRTDNTTSGFGHYYAILFTFNSFIALVIAAIAQIIEVYLNGKQSNIILFVQCFIS